VKGALREAASLVRAAFSAWLDDYAPSMGAALAYYTLFSLAPLLLIVIAVAGLAFGAEAARGEIMGQLAGLVGTESARTIEQLLASFDRPGQSLASGAVGLIVLVVGATTVFAELQDALDRIWRAPARAPGGLWALIRARLLSLGLVFGIGFLLMVSLVVSAALAALSRWWAPWFGDTVAIARVFDLVFGFAVVTTLFAMIYKWMPRVKIAWRDVWLGAAVTALLFSLGKTAIGTYLATSAVASSFGAAASIVVLLVWLYWSAQIFLFGAELTWVYATRHGSLKGRAVPPPAAPARAA
jgi:membrane protein